MAVQNGTATGCAGRSCSILFTSWVSVSSGKRSWSWREATSVEARKPDKNRMLTHGGSERRSDRFCRPKLFDPVYELRERLLRQAVTELARGYFRRSA